MLRTINKLNAMTISAAEAYYSYKSRFYTLGGNELTHNEVGYLPGHCLLFVKTNNVQTGHYKNYTKKLIDSAFDKPKSPALQRTRWITSVKSLLDEISFNGKKYYFNRYSHVCVSKKNLEHLPKDLLLMVFSKP